MALEIAPEWPGFTQEGYTIYARATSQIRTALEKGCTYEQACERLGGLGASALAFIRDDFLKILVAEEYLGNDTPIDALALTLGLTPERIEAVVADLLHDLHQAAIDSATTFPPMRSTLTH